MSQKLFNCQKCDAEIEVNEPSEKTQVRCRRCGEVHLLVYKELSSSWYLKPEQPVEEGSDFRPEEEPFSVLGEASGPEHVDPSEQSREESDRQSDNEAVAPRPASKPDAQRPPDQTPTGD